jgi:hypothetical protein
MVEPATILIIINIIVSASSPIITSIAHLIQHFKRSKCCKNEIEFDNDIELIDNNGLKK